MTLTFAAALASVLSFVGFGLIAAWHVVPWLRTQQRAEALTALIWVQAFRYIALQIFSAQKFGLAVSDGVRDEIATGDLIGALLAITAIVTLRHKARISIVLVWALVVATFADLANSAAAGVHERLFETASGVTWMILTFYVPMLWISLLLIVWQLLRRRNEPLQPA